MTTISVLRKPTTGVKALNLGLELEQTAHSNSPVTSFAPEDSMVALLP